MPQWVQWAEMIGRLTMSVVQWVASLIEAGNTPEEAEEIVVEGPFDYKNQCLIYIPENFPDPSAPDFPSAAAAEMKRLLADRLEPQVLSWQQQFALVFTKQKVNRQ